MMISKLVVWTQVLALVSIIFVGTGCEKNAEDVEAIRQQFQTFQIAFGDGDGSTLASVYSADSIAAAHKVVQLALDGTKEEILKRPVRDRFEIGMIRALGKRSEFSKMDGRAYVAWIAQQNARADSGRELVELDTVKVYGQESTAEPMRGSNRWGTRIRFVKEDGQWKLDMMSIIDAWNDRFTQRVRAAGKTENGFIAEFASLRAGKSLSENDLFGKKMN
jgi:hypothetical protein